jgi:hypothetical protein
VSAECKNSSKYGWRSARVLDFEPCIFVYPNFFHTILVNLSSLESMGYTRVFFDESLKVCLNPNYLSQTQITHQSHFQMSWFAAHKHCNSLGLVLGSLESKHKISSFLYFMNTKGKNFKSLIGI